MEILTLLRLNGKRLTALASVGALCGAVAAAAVSRQAATYQASTTVFVNQALPDGASAFDVGPLVADFQKAVTLPQVRQSVATKLALPIDQVVVTATRNGNDGGSVEVVAESGSPTSAETISQTMSTEGMRFLAQRELDRTKQFEAERQAAYDTATQARNQMLADNAYVNPVTAYNDTQLRFNQLSLDVSDPTKNLTNEQRVAASAEVARLRQSLFQLNDLATQYAKADAAVVDANAQLTEAKKKTTSAQEVLAAATTDVAISAGDTLQASKVASMMQGFAAAVVATFLAGIAFFFAVDSRKKPRLDTSALVGPSGTKAAAAPPVLDKPAAKAPSVPSKAAPAAKNGSADRVAAKVYEPATLEAMEAALEAETQAEPATVKAAEVRPAKVAETAAVSSAATKSWDETKSIFARPADGAAVAASATVTADEVSTDDTTGTADAMANRNRKSANNRRRLGS